MSTARSAAFVGVAECVAPNACMAEQELALTTFNGSSPNGNRFEVS